MVGVLLDTNALSEFFKPSPNPQVIETLNSYEPDNVYVSVLSIGELRKGMELLPPGTRREEVRRFVDRMEREYTDRLLDIDLDVALIWGEITARGKKVGTPIPTTDGLIAATALRHGLNVVTRNATHFESAGALVVNPWLDSSR